MGASARQLSTTTILKIAIPLVLVIGGVITYFVLKKPQKDTDGEGDALPNDGKPWAGTPTPDRPITPSFDTVSPAAPAKPAENSSWNAICFPENRSYFDVRTGDAEKDNTNKVAMIKFILTGVDAKGGILTAGKTRAEIQQLGTTIFNTNSIEQVSQWAKAIQNKRTCYVFKGNTYYSLSGLKK